MNYEIGCVLLATAIAGCGDDGNEQTPPPERSDGEMIYSSPLDDGNTFTCSTCHSLSEPADDGFRRPGHPLAGVTRRATFKNGQLTEMLEAVNSCQVEWMNAEPWTADDPDYLALFDFLDGIAGDGTAVEFEIVTPPTDLTGGDAARGLDTFNGSCAVCHAREGIGSQMAPPVAMRGIMPDLIAARVRTSGRIDSDVYEGLTGGVMPFWSADRISDDELRDIIAWIVSTGEPDPGTGTGTDTDGMRGCSASHALVGAVAELDGRQHNVGGTATIVDDCTIEIANFSFDGGGIDVRVYGGLGGAYNDGFAIGEDLTGPAFNGETITVQLDESRTFDDLDGISIWCVPVGVDFGSGFFVAP